MVALNQAALARMREVGELGDEVDLSLKRGSRTFAAGDRVMFRRHERGLGGMNGTLGTIEAVDARSMTARTDDGRSVAVDLRDYSHFDHGYAATIHQAQGHDGRPRPCAGDTVHG